ncbi:PaaX family transcriptional regulator C-terminal domain-containing protein [Actinomycetospora sp. C-140]
MSESVARRSPTVGLVAYLFAISGREELPGAALVELLGELGLSPAAARQLFARMRAAGQLAGRRSGRRTHHRLVGPIAAQVASLQSPPPPREPWDGQLHAVLHHVPERERAFRDRLRRVAGLLGYGSLQPGVLVAAADRWAELEAALGPVPPDAVVRRARLALDARDVPGAVSAAWDLEGLAADLRGHHAAVRAALGEVDDPPATADTLRRLAALTNQANVDLLRDPGLPPELRPQHWPGDPLRRDLGALAARWLPAARAFVAARVAANGG